MNVIIYIHGKGGCHTEADEYKKNCPGFDMIGVDYDEYLPWIVDKQIKELYDEVRKTYDDVYIIANSIGAYFAMHTLQHCDIKKALFISPILDMEKLIMDMMQWAGVHEKELCEQGEIQTDFGETLSWKFLQFVRAHPIDWCIPTEILYAENDNLTAYKTVESFTRTHVANLTIMNGEHWFHTEEQIAYLNRWMKSVI